MTQRDSGFAAGFGHVVRGFALLRAPGVRLYVVLPLAINVLLFVFALVALGDALDYLLERYLADWPGWLQSLLWGVFAVLASLLVFFSFSVLANIVASPFSGLLAEATENYLRGEQVALSSSWVQLLREISRTLAAELRKLLYIALRALPLVLLSLIPGVNIVAPLLWLCFGAWMLCLEYLDCPLGNHGKVFPAVIEAMRARRRLSLGFGLAMTLVTLTPLLNFIAVPLGVVSATRLYCKHIAQD